jgi:hypothetical protein
MPGAGFRRLASKYANILENELVKKPYEIARQKLASVPGHCCRIYSSLMRILRFQLAGRLKPSFVSHALQNVDTSNMDNDLDTRIKHVAAMIMGGKYFLC